MFWDWILESVWLKSDAIKIKYKASQVANLYKNNHNYAVYILQ